MAEAKSNKDVVYVDIDDEITAIIDKVTGSKSKIVALVLPKRATVLQSVVNMKLLKRSSDEAKKNVVLVTNEAGLMPLAGAVGLHVAPTPQSKPTVPHKPAAVSDEPEAVDEPGDHYDFSPKDNASKPVGALAGAEPIDDTIQLDNEDTPAVPRGKGAAAAAAAGKAAKQGKGKNKKLKVPDFNRFRTKLIVGVLALVVLVTGFVFANVILPKATVAIKTDSEEVQKNLDVTFDTKAAGVDAGKLVVPAVVAQTQKTTTQSVEATGQKNNGERAEGSVTFTVKDCSAPYTPPSNIPAGTGVSSGGKNFITQERGQFSGAGFDSGFTCFNYKTQKIKIIAQSGGSDYNLSDASFTVAGSSAAGEGSTNGGTDNIVKVVQQSDIDSAKQKLESQVDNSVKGELVMKLEEQDLYVIEDSFNPGTPEVTASAKVGDQVDSVTVTQKTTYSVVGAKQSDLELLITKTVEADIDTSKQRVLNTGFKSAKYKVQNQQIANDASTIVMSMNFTALAGPKLDDEELKEQIAGKKAADAKNILTGYPGVTDVEVKYSPFWVSSIPGKTDKITITYEK